MTTSQNAQITLPDDRSQIEEVQARFGRALDQHDWALFEALFTPEVDADYSAFGVPAGKVSRGALVAQMKHSFERPGQVSQQLYSNFEIAVAGREATAVCSLVGYHRQPGQPGGEEFTLRARYHLRLLREAGGWKLAAVRLEVLSTEGNLALVA
jgi:hypothetical protein